MLEPAELRGLVRLVQAVLVAVAGPVPVDALVPGAALELVLLAGLLRRRLPGTVLHK